MFTNMFLKGTVLRDFTLLFVAKTYLLDSLKGFAKLFLFEKFLQKEFQNLSRYRKDYSFAVLRIAFL